MASRVASPVAASPDAGGCVAFLPQRSAVRSFGFAPTEYKAAMEKSEAPLSFEKDVRPLFTETDIDHMAPMGVLLDDYKFMSDPSNAKNVYEFLTGEQEPRMPPGGPYWDQRQLDLFASWMKGGRRP